jgi:hypothetical protein
MKWDVVHQGDTNSGSSGVSNVPSTGQTYQDFYCQIWPEGRTLESRSAEKTDSGACGMDHRRVLKKIEIAVNPRKVS